jgi:hypothetical protein
MRGLLMITSLIAACALAVLVFFTSRTPITSAVAFLISAYRLTIPPHKRDRIFALQVRWRSFKIEKSHQHREFGDAIPDPSEDFDFAIPSLDGEPSDRRAQGGTLLINASTAQTSEFP